MAFCPQTVLCQDEIHGVDSHGVLPLPYWGAATQINSTYRMVTREDLMTIAMMMNHRNALTADEKYSSNLSKTKTSGR